MKRTNFHLFIIISLLFLPTLACGGVSQLPNADDVAAAATKASDAAATAVVMAEQAANAAATAAASEQAQNAVATAVAAATSVQNMELPDTSALREKFAAIQPDANGNVSVTLTDDEMNQAIQAKQTAAEQAGEENLVQEAVVSFTGGYIVLTGNITSPVAAQLTVSFRPYIADGALQFEVVNASIGSVSVPPAILSGAEATLNNTLTEAMGYMPASITLQDVIMGEGTMTITGHKN